MKPTITIIDNQKTHFDKLYDALSDDNNIVPDKENYNSCIEYICIYLNKNYTENVRNKAFNYIVEYFKLKDVLVVVIDYDIVGLGNDKKLNGVDLAIALQKQIPYLQFLFVSFLGKDSSEQTSAKNKLKNNGLDYKFRWVAKGNSAVDVLNKQHIQNAITPKIKDLIQENNKLQDKIIDIVGKWDGGNNETGELQVLIKDAHPIHCLQILTQAQNLQQQRMASQDKITSLINFISQLSNNTNNNEQS
jgi:hypothetical protein